MKLTIYYKYMRHYSPSIGTSHLISMIESLISFIRHLGCRLTTVSHLHSSHALLCFTTGFDTAYRIFFTSIFKINLAEELNIY